MRGPLAHPVVPAMVTRTEAFDGLVIDIAHRYRPVLGRRWEQVEFAVEEVPPSGPADWEDGIPLARLWPAEGRVPARIVVYRRPILTAARGIDHAVIVHDVIVEQIALLLGVDPREIDPGRH